MISTVYGNCLPQIATEKYVDAILGRYLKGKIDGKS